MYLDLLVDLDHWKTDLWGESGSDRFDSDSEPEISGGDENALRRTDYYRNWIVVAEEGDRSVGLHFDYDSGAEIVVGVVAGESSTVGTAAAVAGSRVVGGGSEVGSGFDSGCSLAERVRFDLNWKGCYYYWYYYWEMHFGDFHCRSGGGGDGGGLGLGQVSGTSDYC